MGYVNRNRSERRVFSRHPGFNTSWGPPVRTSGMEELWQIHQLMLVVEIPLFTRVFFAPSQVVFSPIFSSIKSSILRIDIFAVPEAIYMSVILGLWVFSNDACVYRCTYVEIDTNITYTSKFCIKSTWVHISRLWRWYALEKGLGS